MYRCGAIYEDENTVMSERMIRSWVQLFYSERTNMYDEAEARSSQTSIVNGELVHQVDAKIHANDLQSCIALEFPEVLCTFLYEIVTEHLCY